MSFCALWRRVSRSVPSSESRRLRSVTVVSCGFFGGFVELLLRGFAIFYVLVQTSPVMVLTSMEPMMPLIDERDEVIGHFARG